MYDQFKIPNQLELPLNKPRDATPLEQKEWIDGELTYRVELNKKAIVWLSLLQVALLGFMLGTMGLIEHFIGS